MGDRVLIDTDVLIDYLRGREPAVRFLEELDASLLVSVITVAELNVGVRDEEEQAALDGLLRAFEVVPVDHDVAVRGGQLRRRWAPSHGTGLADALIAASALEASATLVTLNRKHFPMLDELHTPYSASAGGATDAEADADG